MMSSSLSKANNKFSSSITEEKKKKKKKKKSSRRSKSPFHRIQQRPIPSSTTNDSLITDERSLFSVASTANNTAVDYCSDNNNNNTTRKYNNKSKKLLSLFSSCICTDNDQEVLSSLSSDDLHQLLAVIGRRIMEENGKINQGEIGAINLNRVNEKQLTSLIKDVVSTHQSCNQSKGSTANKNINEKNKIDEAQLQQLVMLLMTLIVQQKGAEDSEKKNKVNISASQTQNITIHTQNHNYDMLENNHKIQISKNRNNEDDASEGDSAGIECTIEELQPVMKTKIDCEKIQSQQTEESTALDNALKKIAFLFLDFLKDDETLLLSDIRAKGEVPNDIKSESKVEESNINSLINSGETLAPEVILSDLKNQHRTESENKSCVRKKNPLSIRNYNTNMKNKINKIKKRNNVDSTVFSSPSSSVDSLSKLFEKEEDDDEITVFDDESDDNDSNASSSEDIKRNNEILQNDWIEKELLKQKSRQKKQNKETQRYFDNLFGTNNNHKSQSEMDKSSLMGSMFGSTSFFSSSNNFKKEKGNILSSMPMKGKKKKKSEKATDNNKKIDSQKYSVPKPKESVLPSPKMRSEIRPSEEIKVQFSPLKEKENSTVKKISNSVFTQFPTWNPEEGIDIENTMKWRDENKENIAPPESNKQFGEMIMMPPTPTQATAVLSTQQLNTDNTGQFPALSSNFSAAAVAQKLRLSRTSVASNKTSTKTASMQSLSIFTKELTGGNKSKRTETNKGLSFPSIDDRQSVHHLSNNRAISTRSLSSSTQEKKDPPGRVLRHSQRNNKDLSDKKKRKKERSRNSTPDARLRRKKLIDAESKKDILLRRQDDEGEFDYNSLASNPTNDENEQSNKEPLIMMMKDSPSEQEKCEVIIGSSINSANNSANNNEVNENIHHNSVSDYNAEEELQSSNELDMLIRKERSVRKGKSILKANKKSKQRKIPSEQQDFASEKPGKLRSIFQNGCGNTEQIQEEEEDLGQPSWLIANINRNITKLHSRNRASGKFVKAEQRSLSSMDENQKQFSEEKGTVKRDTTHYTPSNSSSFTSRLKLSQRIAAAEIQKKSYMMGNSRKLTEKLHKNNNDIKNDSEQQQLRGKIPSIFELNDDDDSVTSITVRRIGSIGKPKSMQEASTPLKSNRTSLRSRYSPQTLDRGRPKSRECSILEEEDEEHHTPDRNKFQNVIDRRSKSSPRMQKRTRNRRGKSKNTSIRNEKAPTSRSPRSKSSPRSIGRKQNSIFLSFSDDEGEDESEDENEEDNNFTIMKSIASSSREKWDFFSCSTNTIIDDENEYDSKDDNVMNKNPFLITQSLNEWGNKAIKKKSSPTCVKTAFLQPCTGFVPIEYDDEDDRFHDDMSFPPF